MLRRVDFPDRHASEKAPTQPHQHTRKRVIVPIQISCLLGQTSQLGCDRNQMQLSHTSCVTAGLKKNVWKTYNYAYLITHSNEQSSLNLKCRVAQSVSSTRALSKCLQRKHFGPQGYCIGRVVETTRGPKCPTHLALPSSIFFAK